MKLVITTLLLLALGAPAFSQAPLSEVEQLKMQILNLQILLRTEQANSASWITAYGECKKTELANTGDLAANMKKVEQDIEKTRVGFDFDMKTGTFKASAPPPDKK